MKRLRAGKLYNIVGYSVMILQGVTPIGESK